MRWGRHTEALLRRLEHDALNADPAVLEAWSRDLMAFSSSDLLLLDHHSRAAPYWGVPIVGDAKAWDAVEFDESSAVRAVVASWHRSGYIRERATESLSHSANPLAARALAVRAMDVVAPVRTIARSAILRASDERAFVDVIDVVASADRGRWGLDARQWVETWIFDSSHSSATVEACLKSQRGAARRWALSWGAERGVISRERLTQIAICDVDQWMSPRAAVFVLDADPGSTSALSLSRSAAVRLLVAAAAGHEEIDASWFAQLCTDPSARVSRTARAKAREHSVDFGKLDEQALKEGIPRRRVIAALSEVSAQSPGETLDLVATLLAHPTAAVRAAAALAIARAWPTNRAAPALASLLEDESAGVARTAAKGLARLRAPASLADSAWISTSPASRSSAWVFVSRLGAWDALEGHLRAVTDAHADIHALGRRGVGTWVRDVAPRAWTAVPELQRQRILRLLDAAALDAATKREIAFCVRSVPA